MKLKEFIEKFVMHNTLVRLWIKRNNEKHLIYELDQDKPGGVDDLRMEWQILKGDKLTDKYLDWTVIGVSSILNEYYPESINIVLAGPAH